MGQAKNRGTREQRVAQAQIRMSAEQLGERLLAARRRNLAASALRSTQTAATILANAIDSVGTTDSCEVAHG
jgi:hypothetical protein